MSNISNNLATGDVKLYTIKNTIFTNNIIEGKLVIQSTENCNVNGNVSLRHKTR